MKIKFEQEPNNHNPEKTFNEIEASEQMREILEIDKEKDVKCFKQEVKDVTKNKLIPFIESYEFKNFCNLEAKKTEKQIEVLDSFKEKIFIEDKESMPIMILNSVNEKLGLSLGEEDLPKIVNIAGNSKTFYNIDNNLIVIGEGNTNNFVYLGEEIMHFYRKKIKKPNSKINDNRFENIAIDELFGRLGEAFVVKYFPEFKESRYNERNHIKNEGTMKYLSCFLNARNNKGLENFLEKSSNAFYLNVIQEIFLKIPEIKKDFSIWEKIHLNYLKNPEKIDPSGLHKDIMNFLIGEMQVFEDWKEKKQMMEELGDDPEILEPSKNGIYSKVEGKQKNINYFFDEQYGHLARYSIAEFILEEYEEILEPENFRKLLSMSDEEILEIYKPFLKKKNISSTRPIEQEK